MFDFGLGFSYSLIKKGSSSQTFFLFFLFDKWVLEMETLNSIYLL